MLIKLLSGEDKKHLLSLVKLLSLADNPLLWDGKRKEQITSETDLDKLTIQTVEQENTLFQELESEHPLEPNSSTAGTFGFFQHTNNYPVEKRLLEKLKVYPLQSVEAPESRAQAALAVLRELLEGKQFDRPFIPKLMLFELMLMALCSENITSIEWVLLKEFQNHHHLEDFIFEDLLERADAVTREVSKTISIILE